MEACLCDSADGRWMVGGGGGVVGVNVLILLEYVLKKEKRLRVAGKWHGWIDLYK
jgi:hypothetical protein